MEDLTNMSKAELQDVIRRKQGAIDHLQDAIQQHINNHDDAPQEPQEPQEPQDTITTATTINREELDKLLIPHYKGLDDLSNRLHFYAGKVQQAEMLVRAAMEFAADKSSESLLKVIDDLLVDAGSGCRLLSNELYESPYTLSGEIMAPMYRKVFDDESPF